MSDLLPPLDGAAAAIAGGGFPGGGLPGGGFAAGGGPERTFGPPMINGAYNNNILVDFGCE